MEAHLKIRADFVVSKNIFIGDGTTASHFTNGEVRVRKIAEGGFLYGQRDKKSREKFNLYTINYGSISKYGTIHESKVDFTNVVNIDALPLDILHQVAAGWAAEASADPSQE